MKRMIYFIMLLLMGGAYVGCSENEIALYDQTPRINFYSTVNIRYFVDTDYVDRTPYIVDSFKVRIQGDLLTANRDFCLKAVANDDYKQTVEVELDGKYTYTALDTVCQTYYYKIKRPETVETGNNVYGCSIAFDLDNPAHQFDKGLVEKNQLTVNVRWDLKPDDWADWVGFGSYSDAKYMFIMDTCHRVWADLQDEDIPVIQQAYKAYIEAGNPPIYGDDGDEIEYE